VVKKGLVRSEERILTWWGLDYDFTFKKQKIRIFPIFTSKIGGYQLPCPNMFRLTF